MKKLSLLLLVALTVFISSCEKDLKINAPYKEIAVVYGLLNPDDAVQYIRINKSFLGEGNANEMAKVPDSSNYQEGELDVRLERYLGKQLKETIVFQDTVTTIADPGAFSSKQILYKTNAKITQDASIYKLIIKNKKTNNIVTSETKVLGFFTGFAGLSNFYSGSNYTNNSATWDCSSADENSQAQVLVTFHYTEVTATGSTPKTVVWQRPSVVAGDKKSPLPGVQFFSFIGASIPFDSKVISRKIGKLDYTLVVVPYDLNLYIEVNKPTTSIVQEKNQITNITNGIGFFSSRLFIYNNDRVLTETTIMQLISGPYTKDLKFTN